MLHTDLFALMHEYVDKGLTPIPTHGKRPIINSWQDIEVTHEAIDVWENTLQDCNGFGVRLGNGIGCIDYDTDDHEILNRLSQFFDIPETVVKKGKKGKTVFFKYDYQPKKMIYSHKMKGFKEPIVEIFYGSKQTVVPPSIHPETGLKYQWIVGDLLYADLDDLPTITEQQAELAETVINARSMSDAIQQLPSGVAGSNGEGGRWSTITREAGILLKQGLSDDHIINHVVAMDRLLFAGNQYFLSREKMGGSFVSADNDLTNAVKWYANFKQNILKNDVDALAAMTARVEILSSSKNNDPMSLSFGQLPPTDFKSHKKTHYTVIPEDLYPEILSDYIKACMELSNMPASCFILPMFCAGGFSAQGKYTIRPKIDFVTRPNLYGLIVAPSGSRKDNAFDRAISPLRDVIDDIKKSINKPTALQDIKDLEERINAIDKKKKLINKECPEDMETQLDTLNQEILEISAQLREKKAMQMDLVFESGSTERLMKMMQDNQEHGVFMNQTEFVLMMGMMGKSGNEVMRGLILKAANGMDRGFSHKTIAGTNVSIDRLIATMFGGIQTSVYLREIEMIESFKGQDDGLLNRFLICAPNGEIKRMSLDVHELDDSAYRNTLYRYMTNTIETEIQLSREVAEIYVDFDEHINRLRQGKTGFLSSTMSKYSSTLLKIAFMYEMYRKENANKCIKEITKESMLKAVRYLNIQSSDVQLLVSNVNQEQVANAASLIVNAFSGEATGSMAINNVIRKTGIKSTVIVNEAIDLLVETNWVKVDHSTRIMYINPKA